MASHPPGKCCTEITFHTGETVGTLETLHGVETYVTGKENSSSRVIVILTDVYGHNLKNVNLIADKLAKVGKYQVYIPDILKGDPYDSSKGFEHFPVWMENHDPAETQATVGKFLKGIHNDLSPSFVGLIGYCFGAKYAIQQITKDGPADAAAVAHPSFVTMDEVEAIAKPILISSAETDQIYPPDLRAATEAKLAEIKARYQTDLFSGVSHGYACRGDMNDPLVRYAAEKTLLDQIHWFSMF